jgi:hypothetical protein
MFTVITSVRISGISRFSSAEATIALDVRAELFGGHLQRFGARGVMWICTG